GYIGARMLIGAISGVVFASPPFSAALNSTETVVLPGEPLLFVISYTGDRFNFGVAAERYQ
ncbi:hypothetical protein Angca_005334, partial [Angiostrongylus cantonensis]